MKDPFCTQCAISLTDKPLRGVARALKTKGNTPKYGLIFHSSFIGRAKQRNKGRISRYLANKCSIASRYAPTVMPHGGSCELLPEGVNYCRHFACLSNQMKRQHQGACSGDQD